MDDEDLKQEWADEALTESDELEEALSGLEQEFGLLKQTLEETKDKLARLAPMNQELQEVKTQTEILQEKLTTEMKKTDAARKRGERLKRKLEEKKAAEESQTKRRKTVATPKTKKRKPIGEVSLRTRRRRLQEARRLLNDAVELVGDSIKILGTEFKIIPEDPEEKQEEQIEQEEELPAQPLSVMQLALTDKEKDDISKGLYLAMLESRMSTRAYNTFR